MARQDARCVGLDEHAIVCFNCFFQTKYRLPSYFREIDAETRLGHLRALIALQMADQKQEISLYSKVSSLESK